MEKIALYMDEDSTSRSLLMSLRSRGVDVTTALEINRLGYSDEDQLIWATSMGRTVYSYNVKDFYSLHTQFLEQGRNHAGLILVQQQKYSIGELLRGVLRLVNVLSSEDMINQIEFGCAQKQLLGSKRRSRCASAAAPRIKPVSGNKGGRFQKCLNGQAQWTRKMTVCKICLLNQCTLS